MRTDPRKACDNPEESWFWAIVHDVFAHPLSALTLYSAPAVRFHNWTSEKAWPRKKSAFKGEPDLVIPLEYLPEGNNVVVVKQLSEGIWEVSHPRVAHLFRTNAKTRTEAIEKAVKWFVELSKEFGGRFEMFI